MENKENAWLYEEFGIKEEDTYVLYTSGDEIIKGNILYYGFDKIIIRSKKGLYTLPQSEINILRPLPIKKERFKIGGYFELKQGCIIGDYVFEGKFDDIIATTVFYKGINGIVYHIDNNYIYVDGNKYGKFRIEKRRL